MKLQFDEKADALYLSLSDATVFESEEVYPGVVLDFNEKHALIGIEILGVKSNVDVISRGLTLLSEQTARNQLRSAYRKASIRARKGLKAELEGLDHLSGEGLDS